MSRKIKYKFGIDYVTEEELAFRAVKRAEELSTPAQQEAYLSIVQQSLSAHISTKTMRNKVQTVYLPIIGVFFLVVILTIAYFTPFPSKFQSGTIWVILSLGAAASAAFIPGFIEFRFKGFVTAGGAIAVFCLMYFFSPDIIHQTESYTNKKVVLFVITTDTLSRQKIAIDYDPNSNITIVDMVSKGLATYYGTNFTAKDFICYRKSDGKIYSNEICKEIEDRNVLMISYSIANSFPDRRQAYLHYNALFDKVQ